jgi:hypothetical protein
VIYGFVRALQESIFDAGWEMLKENLIYVAERALGVTESFDSRNSSQTRSLAVQLLRGTFLCRCIIALLVA